MTLIGQNAFLLKKIVLQNPPEKFE